MPIYQGGCHCGRVKFEVEATPTHLSQCNCSICSAKGALYIPAREIQAFRILAGEAELVAYQFNTRTATHYFCKHCGIHTFHHPRMNPALWSVNARTVKDVGLLSLPRREFDGQNWEEAARKGGWIK